jgi:hypothetical protein
MRSLVVRFVVLAGVAMVLAGCSGGAPADAKKRSYIDTANRFALNAPSGWAKQENVMNAKVVFLAPTKVNGFAPNLNVVMVPAAAKSIDELLRINRKQLATFNGFREIAARKITHPNGREAIVIEAEHSMMSMPLRIKCYGFLVGDKEIGITATMPASDVDAWMPKIDKAINSLIVW